eukprot:Skav232722  [mRNA]  locus=scaffold3777:19787:26844:- [translate_table: standard]
MLINCAPEEASCSASVRLARDLVSDLGVERASSSGGLVQLSQLDEHNAERDCNKLLAKKLELSLPIPLEPMGTEECCKGIPVLRLRDWCAYFLKSHNWHVLAGLKKPDPVRVERMFQLFWDRYRLLYPQHQIFALADAGKLNLGRTAPMLVHGDEGRSKKHQPFLVCSVHSCLGFGLGPSEKKVVERKRAGEKVKKPYLKQSCNFLGHSYTHRFILGCLPKKYAAKKEVFQALMGHIARESDFMRSTGVVDPFTKRTYHMAVIAVVGDWPWLCKSGGLERSFSTAQKFKVVKTPPKGFCHFCLAGRPGVPGFSELHSRNPTWLQSMYVEEPWSVEPELASLLHEPGKKAHLYQFDLFHCVHLGVGRNLIGAVLALVSEMEPSGTIDARFDSMSQRFMNWCRDNHRTPYITSLSKEKIGWGVSAQQYPCAQWHKGSVTTTVLAWLEDELGATDLNQTPILKVAFESVQALNGCLRGLFSSEVWVFDPLATDYAEKGLRFLRRYSVAAAMAHRAGRKLFGFQPKCHALHKVFLLMLLQCRAHGFAINPAVYSVQPDEDLIGRASRISRKVHPAQQVRRVLERYLLSAHSEWVRAGFLVVSR